MILKWKHRLSTFIQRIEGDRFTRCIPLTTIQRDFLNKTEKGFIIVGELPIGIDKELFWKFAKALNWPVLCDPLSNLRAEVPDKLYGSLY